MCILFNISSSCQHETIKTWCSVLKSKSFSLAKWKQSTQISAVLVEALTSYKYTFLEAFACFREEATALNPMYITTQGKREEDSSISLFLLHFILQELLLKKYSNFVMPDNKINGAQSMGALSWQNHWKVCVYGVSHSWLFQNVEGSHLWLFCKINILIFFSIGHQWRRMKNKMEAEVAKTADYTGRYGTK